MDEVMLAFEILISLVAIQTILLIYVLKKTPALKFLKASMSKKMILIHPKDSRYLEFLIAKRESATAEVKGNKQNDHYIINPKDVYIESTSKVPVTMVYGKFALSIDPKMADVAARMRELGIKYFDGLKTAVEELWKKDSSIKLNVLGESVDLADAVDYFNASERSDFIEAEIQQRAAAQIESARKQPGDLFKWAVIAVIVLIGGAVAYVMVVNAITPGAGGSPSIIQSAASALQPVSNPGQGMVIQ